ncbi:MAG: ATP-binding protein, partial [Pseudomonadota bacterium]
DKDYNLIKVNSTFCSFFGLKREDIIGKKCYDVWRSTLCDETTCPLKSIVKDGLLQSNYEVEKKRGDGQPVWCIVTAIPYRNDDGEVIGIVENVTDLSDRKLAEEQREEILVRLARSNRELEEFARVASHDLQEPLRKVRAFGDRLKEKYSSLMPEAGQEYIERMQSAAIRMQALIDDILTYSRVTTKAKPFTSISLREIVEELLVDMEVRIEKISAHIEIGELPVIEGDRSQISQLFMNIIGNAFKFHKKETPPIVKISQADSSDTPANMCSILIEDNGIGFDTKYLDRIFQPFQRLHGRGEYEGSGIGLAICRKIVEHHNGTITARSLPGKGATFIISLPIKTCIKGE